MQLQLDEGGPDFALSERPAAEHGYVTGSAHLLDPLGDHARCSQRSFPTLFSETFLLSRFARLLSKV